MPETPRLHAGDLYPCPRCRTPHVVEQPYIESTTADRSHLYVTCRGQRYFVGQDLRDHPFARIPAIEEVQHADGSIEVLRDDRKERS